MSSWPRNCTEPVTRAVLGSRPRIASEVTDLPQPDSPTIASTSPGRTSKDTPSTARTAPSGVENSTLRSRTLSSGGSGIEPDPGVQEGIGHVDQRREEHDEEGGVQRGPHDR